MQNIYVRTYNTARAESQDDSDRLETMMGCHTFPLLNGLVLASKLAPEKNGANQVLILGRNPVVCNLIYTIILAMGVKRVSRR